MAFLQGIASISQSVGGFVPGANYVLSFAAALRNYQLSNGGQTWNATLNGKVIASYAPPTTATSYASYSASFTAPIRHECAGLGQHGFAWRR